MVSGMNYLKGFDLNKSDVITRVSIVGTRGVPANYGGFETLAENLVIHAASNDLTKIQLAVYCSGKRQSDSFNGSELRYVNISANGIASVFYDVYCILDSVKKGDDSILILGVSGAIVLPFVRLFCKTRILINVDGVEWKRDKWGLVAKTFLRLSEFLAVKSAHKVIADNTGIADHILEEYSHKSEVIAYGGDHAIRCGPKKIPFVTPDIFALALCRIEPENNVVMILDGFVETPEFPLIFIGNWSASLYGTSVRKKYSEYPHLILLDPIYDIGVLRSIRSLATCYVHGHSAGGTNPSLVEMMHFGACILSYDCIFNRYTTHNEALYFKNSDGLIMLLADFDSNKGLAMGSKLARIANDEYVWSKIAEQYFDLL